MSNFVDIALSQVGYLEKASNSQLDHFTANAGNNNWTKYGAWYGMNGPPALWCHIFVSWCAFTAGIGTDVIPKTASCATGVNWFKQQGKFKLRSSGYIPNRGDIIYFAEGNFMSHVGIVVRADGSYVDTVEGNTNSDPGVVPNGGSVNTKQYRLTSTYIYGYGTPDAVAGLTTSRRQQFVLEAESHVGTDGTWSYQQSGLPVGSPWCAAFIMACAKQVGILDVVIPSGWGAGLMAYNGEQRGMGKIINGPLLGNNAVPQLGDLIIFERNGPFREWYLADHIGIVRGVANNKVHTVEGNSDGKMVRLKEWLINNASTLAYYRPDWSLVGDTGFTVAGSNVILYDGDVNTREDAIIREVGYLDSQYKPSVRVSGVRLAVVNYTTLLSTVVNMFGQTPKQSANMDMMDDVPRTIVEFFVDKGLSYAAGIGIIANIAAESSFRTDAKGDRGLYGSKGFYATSSGPPTSFGLCQWHNSSPNTGRGQNMKTFVGPNWETNLTGQLEYLWYELNKFYNSSVLVPLQNVKVSLNGAKDAAEVFVRKFEVPGNVEAEVVKRRANAETYWSQIVPVLVSSEVPTSGIFAPGMLIPDLVDSY